jgi:hypothetical protein
MGFLSEKQIGLLSIQNLEKNPYRDVFLRWQNTPPLPIEVWDHIFNYLDLKDEKVVNNISTTCHFFREIRPPHHKNFKTHKYETVYKTPHEIQSVVKLPNGHIAVALRATGFFHPFISINILDGKMRSRKLFYTPFRGQIFLSSLNNGNLLYYGDPSSVHHTKYQRQWCEVNAETGEILSSSNIKPSEDLIYDDGFTKNADLSLPNGDKLAFRNSYKSRGDRFELSICISDSKTGEIKNSIQETVNKFHKIPSRLIILDDGNILCVFDNRAKSTNKLALLRLPPPTLLKAFELNGEEKKLSQK